mgnify:FL=1
MIQENGLEKLKGKIRVDLVFKKGKALKSGALIMHYFVPEEGAKKTHMGIGVPKKTVLMAYRRNRIKRQMRAIVRLREEEILASLWPGFYMLLYKGKAGVTSESLLHDFRALLKRFTQYD